MANQDIRVELGAHSYNVTIEPGLLSQLPRIAALQLASYGPRRPVPFIADANTHAAYHQQITEVMESAGKPVEWFIIAPGESSKSWASLEKLTDWLLALGITRSDSVFAFGGGIVGDLTGFACAVLKRGCRFVQIPTSLLAQVDSSVGGKTAINTAAGKNLIGAFHQPSAVLIDPLVLPTLPDREMRAGLAEIIKYALLGDAEFFTWLEANHPAILAREPKALAHAIATSIKAKARIVAADERETKDARALLNLGHTFGHALEAETGFGQALLHGEAVGLGMVLAAHYSARRGDLSHAAAKTASDLIEQAGLPVRLQAVCPGVSGAKLAAHMRHDKKIEGDTLPFILMRAIGEAYLARDVELGDIAAFLDTVRADDAALQTNNAG